MKKLINLFFLLLAMTTMSLISCSKNDIDNDSEFDIPEGNRELYDQITTELYDYLYSHEDATIEDIQEQLKKYSTSVTSEVKDNILYLKIDSVYDFMCDPYRRTCVSEQEENGNCIDELKSKINSALYPESRSVDINRTDYNHNTVRSNEKTRGWNEWWQRVKESFSKDVLKKEKIMIWDPWGESGLEDFLNKKVLYYKSDSHGNNYFEINGKKIVIDSYYKLDAGLNLLEVLDNYDVVYMYCHGVPDPDNSEKYTICYPSVGFFDFLFGRGPNLKKGKILNKKNLEYRLPEDLSKTVIFSAICWGDLSHLKDIAMSRKCVGFAGANTKIVTGLVRFPFVNFIYSFYAGCNIIDAAQEGLCYEATQSSRQTSEGLENTISHNGNAQVNGSNVIMRYTNINMPIDHQFPDGPMESVSGYYTFSCNNINARTKSVFAAMDAVNGLPLGSLTMPYDQFVSSLASREGTRATRELSDDGFSMGFWVRNKETKEEMEIEISDTTVDIYKNEHNPYFYPKDDNLPKEIVRVEVLGKTDGLTPGTYEYRTYLEIDGEKEYSDEVFEFTVSNPNMKGYAEYNTEENALIIKYGIKPEGRIVYDIPNDISEIDDSYNNNDLMDGYWDKPVNAPGWFKDNNIGPRKMVIDPSFANFKPVCTNRWFCGVSEIIGLEYLNTSNVVDMSHMFDGCKVKELNLSYFNTSNVVNMVCMFKDCKELTNLDISHFDTKNVLNMSHMFDGCKSLETLDLSHFDTKNVLNMSYMFNKCYSISSFDISSFETSNVFNMEFMFNDIWLLTSLDLSNFDTRNVRTMTSMFYGCENLKNLVISNFDTRNVCDMSNMFRFCKSLNKIDLSSFNTGNVENMSSMFRGCSSLTNINMESFNTSKVNDMSYMFTNCKNLTVLDLSSFDNSSLSSIKGMFNDCSNLKTIYVSEWKTVREIDNQTFYYVSCFVGCNELVGGKGSTLSIFKSLQEKQLYSWSTSHGDVFCAKIDEGYDSFFDVGLFTAK